MPSNTLGSRWLKAVGGYCRFIYVGMLRALFSCLVILVSFLWGYFMFNEMPSNGYLAIAGVASLCLGIIGIV